MEEVPSAVKSTLLYGDASSILVPTLLKSILRADSKQVT